ncbi:uncharacterized protein [Nicotiana tomentosiformis]|uniref:uncharacterized protein n=1 Tax=Nicotiana tomentosiformis TaxID=4098 RepID=UPI000878A21E|nr:uncharacterized protein LOC104118350 [Nicotiana tomentosiformis]
MGDAIPLCASPCGNATVSYQKGTQSLKVVVSIYKKIRLPEAFGGQSDGGLVRLEDIWWLIYSYFSFLCIVAALLNLEHVPGIFTFLFMVGGFIIHFTAHYSVVYWHRDMPFQIIGAKAKFMIEVIPVMTAAVLHHLLEFNYGYLALLLGCTTYFYVFGHFMHVSYDIVEKDLLLELVMQVLVYMVDGELLVRALALTFCVGLCFYRYMIYCTPEVPKHPKKELEQLPV